MAAVLYSGGMVTETTKRARGKADARASEYTFAPPTIGAASPVTTQPATDFLPRVAKEKTNMNDGEKLLLERRRRGLTACELAPAAGICPTTDGKINGAARGHGLLHPQRSPPSRRTRGRLCRDPPVSLSGDDFRGCTPPGDVRHSFLGKRLLKSNLYWDRLN
jgi:hypothetical protein